MNEITVSSHEKSIEDLILRAEETKTPEDRALATAEAQKFFASHPEEFQASADLLARGIMESVSSLDPYLPSAEFVAAERKAMDYEGAPSHERVAIDASILCKLHWLTAS